MHAGSVSCCRGDGEGLEKIHQVFPTNSSQDPHHTKLPIKPSPCQQQALYPENRESNVHLKSFSGSKSTFNVPIMCVTAKTDVYFLKYGFGKIRNLPWRNVLTAITMGAKSQPMNLLHLWTLRSCLDKVKMGANEGRTKKSEAPRTDFMVWGRYWWWMKTLMWRKVSNEPAWMLFLGKCFYFTVEVLTSK